MLETVENAKIPNIGFLPSRILMSGREGYVDRQTCGETKLKYKVLKAVEAEDKEGLILGWMFKIF